MKIFRFLIAVVFVATLLASTVAVAQEDADLDALLGELDAAGAAEQEADAEADEGDVDVVAEDAVIAVEDEQEAEEVAEGGDVVAEDAVVVEEDQDTDLGGLLDEMEESEEASEVEMEGEEAAPEESADEAVVAEEADMQDQAQELGLSPEELEQQMIIQRQASEEEGKQRFKEGQEALQEGKSEAAIKAFGDALVKIPVRPANDQIRTSAREGLVRAHYSSAESNLKRKNFEAARTQLTEARSRLEGVGPEFNERIQDDISDLKDDIAEAEEKYARERTDEALEIQRIEEEEQNIENLLDRGKEMMSRKEYDQAENFFNQVLELDPYNKAAMRFLKKVEDYRYQVSSLNLKTTREDMIQDVRAGWNPPIKVELRTPSRIGADTERSTKTATQELRKRMEDIVIPSIEFRQANIVDVISFLRDASEASDTKGLGVNIILKLPKGGNGGGATATQRQPAAEEDTGFGDDIWSEFETETARQPGRGDGGESSVTGVSDIPTITLNLRRVSLMDAIKYVTEVADLKYRLEENVVIITPANMVQGTPITRMYPVQPSFLDVVVTRTEDQQSRSGGTGGGEFIEMGGGETSMEKSDVKEFFINSGVPFPQGTSITYNSSISQLIVSNTPENLEVFERILSQLNVIPKQVEIEARFVEVAQNDLEELGFEWLLNDNYEMLVKDGAGPVGGRERIVMGENASRGGFTSGIRYFSDTESGIGPASATTGALYGMGGILGISSILTNPEVSMVLHALDQKGGVDLLSAPRVTTRSGVNAQIKIVREIIYPTEFEMDEINIQQVDENGQRFNTRSVVVTPEGFETRETGVIMNVTPTVGPDGYTIDLSMVPEVAELVDWIQYGSDEYNIPQPVFSSRQVTTSIVIWDGQTVVMGGMIREQLTTVDDKVPFLGSIPIVGRFFQNKGEYSRKQNLLIFVTARLVDPAGNRIRKPGETVPELPTS